MKLLKPVTPQPKSRCSCLCRIFWTACLLCLVFFLWSAFVAPHNTVLLLNSSVASIACNSTFNKCENQCRPTGSEALPEGIVSNTSDLEMRPLWDPHKKRVNSLEEDNEKNVHLLAVAVRKKQKDVVHEMVRKFQESHFAVMLFHYDGNLDEWKDFEWSDSVIHIYAINQTKWWFAKQFLHPDIIAKYSYIFLWDEDLGIENFHPDRYLSIVKAEGLEISQPALEVAKSDVHHQITARGRRSNVHRRIYKPGGAGKGCDGSSTAPPCTGWIEVMAPVFSKAAWRCVWYMIQNDLIHGWGLDTQLGYCAQGDRTQNVGVVDAEYIVHYGLPTLGGVNKNKVPSKIHPTDHRVDVRRQSYMEMDIFWKRWTKSAEEDKCWIDPFQ